jgi:hypothetical protein
MASREVFVWLSAWEAAAGRREKRTKKRGGVRVRGAGLREGVSCKNSCGRFAAKMTMFPNFLFFVLK